MPALSRQQSADTLAGLARLLASGLPPDRCLELLAGQIKGNSALQRGVRRLRDGAPLPRVCRETGLITPREQRWLEAAAATGDPAPALGALAESRSRRRRRATRLHTRLLLPAGVLVVGALTAPLPALVAGSLSGGGYLLRAGTPLLGAALAVAAVRRLARRHAAGRLPALDDLLLALPGLGRMIRLDARVQLFDQLARLGRAGLPADRALTLALQGLPQQALARRWAAAAGHVAAGGGVVEGLKQAGALSPEDHSLLEAGEQSGRLEESLARRARTLAEDLEHLQDLALGALPWICYALVLAWVGASLGALRP